MFWSLRVCSSVCSPVGGFFLCFLFFFNDTATTEIYTLSLHDALPISERPDTCPLICLILGNGAARHCPLICLILASGAARHLPAHLPDTRQRSRATPACSSA